MLYQNVLILEYFRQNIHGKGLVRDTLEVGADKFTDMGADSLLVRFYSTQADAKLCYFWELSRKFPRILVPCKSVVDMLALTYSSYQPESICSACGTLVTNYVEHCIL